MSKSGDGSDSYYTSDDEYNSANDDDPLGYFYTNHESISPLIETNITNIFETQRILKSNQRIKMNTRFQYLHVSSLDREQTKSDDDAVLNINLSGHSIKHISNVAVKSFSINNSLFNVTSQRNTLRFSLVLKKANNDFKQKVFSIKIPEGYYENKDLIDSTAGGASGIINQLLATQQGIHGFKVDNETNSHTITMDYNPDTYKVGLNGVGGGGTFTYLALVPLRGDGDDLWNSLGFTQDQTVPIQSFGENIYDQDAQEYEFHKSTDSSDEKLVPILTANHPTSMENVQGIYLTSQALVAGGTYESKLINGHIQANPMNILEFIQFDQSHYSTISYRPDVLHQHYLNGKDINQIDINVTDTNGKLYRWSEIGHFQLVLVFECLIQDEISAQFIKQYNIEGYQKAHTAQNLMLGKFK